MNIRKTVDYSAMFVALDKLVEANLPQMELYCEIGQLVSGRSEKGAAVAAAEYLRSAYPDVPGFSPRNLRRMRDFYRTYESTPEVLAQAMTIGWTQNVIILEAELTIQERTWCILAVRQYGWPKMELQRQIKAGTHKENSLDFEDEVCYTEKNTNRAEYSNDDVNNSEPGYNPSDRKGGEENGKTRFSYQCGDWSGLARPVRKRPGLAEAGLLPPVGCIPARTEARPGVSAVWSAANRQNHAPPSGCVGYVFRVRGQDRLHQGYHNGHHGGAEPGHGAATRSGFPLYSAGRSHADTRLHRLRCPAV